MPIFPTRATPNMTMADVANVINDLGRQIEAANRTQIIRDENGTNRILIGRDPNGNYVVAITKPNIDVIEKLSV